MYDDDGRLSEGRDGKPVPRLNVPTPCGTCPRKSPDNEAATTMTPALHRAYEFYLKVRSSYGRYLDGRGLDEVASLVLATCEMAVEDHRQSIQIELACLANSLKIEHRNT